MHTDQLIAELATSGQLNPRPRLRIAVAIVAGWLVALAGLLVFVGHPLKEVHHTGMASFAVKLGYTLAVASLSALAAIAAGRPGRQVGGPMALITLPVILLLFVTVLELASANAAARQSMMFGTEYFDCVMSVVLASLPVFAAMIWAYRILAPTRLPLAGFLIGLSAGAAGAMAFALYCHEATAAFLLAAYTPAMLVPAMLGAVIARPLLKW